MRLVRFLPIAAVGALLNALLFGNLLGAALPEREPAAAADAQRVPRIVVLGFDGVDYRMLQEYVDADQLPAFAQVIASGAVRPLEPELPPESPVSWSSLLTGLNPGGHGVFDFIRVPDDYEPLNGMVDVKRARLLLDKVALRPPILKSRLRAPTFVERVRDAGYPVLSLRQPLLFPAPSAPGGRFTAGLGTPDVAGSAGYYTAYSSRIGFGHGTTTFGGLQVPLPGGPVARSFTTELYGPFDPTLGRDERGARKRACVPLRFEVVGDGDDAKVHVDLDGREEVIGLRERTPLMPVTFDIGVLPPAKVHGLVRFEVKQLFPLFVLTSPVNFDPRNPPFPISTPPEYGDVLWNRYGAYETVGWQEETFPLNDRFQDDEAFLADLLGDMERGSGMLLGEMDRGEKLVFAVFTATDRACHAFYRYHDVHHPLFEERKQALGDPILTVFQAADRIVGEVVRRLGPDDVLLIVSDHGFQTWHWSVHLNQWLVDHGYMTLKADQEQKSLDHVFAGLPGADAVDWKHTRAFAMGLGQIYINEEGRYGQGAVAPEDVDALADEIRRGLLELTNPYEPEGEREGRVGNRPIVSVTRLRDVYTGRFVGEAPHLQVGFANGYRVSWQTALLGGMSHVGDVFEKNRVPWSGDHCSTEQKLVPGILVSNRALPDGHFTVRDIAATVLEHFGIEHDDLDGDARAIPLGPKP